MHHINVTTHAMRSVFDISGDSEICYGTSIHRCCQYIYHLKQRVHAPRKQDHNHSPQLSDNWEETTSTMDDTGPTLMLMQGPGPPPQPPTPKIMGHHHQPTSVHSPPHNHFPLSHTHTLSLSPIHPKHTHDPPPIPYEMTHTFKTTTHNTTHHTYIHEWHLCFHIHDYEHFPSIGSYSLLFFLPQNPLHYLHTQPHPDYPGNDNSLKETQYTSI